MNNRYFYRSTLVALVAMTAAPWVHAETPAAALKRCVTESYQLFHGGLNDDAAEAKLTGLSQAAAASGDWHFYLAFNLIRVAVVAQESNDATVVDHAARRALAHLDLAEPLFPGDTMRLSDLNALRGAVRERYLSDVPSAVTSYAQAVLLNPDNELAVESLKRCKALLPPDPTVSTTNTTTTTGSTTGATDTTATTGTSASGSTTDTTTTTASSSTSSTTSSTATSSSSN